MPARSGRSSPLEPDLKGIEGFDFAGKRVGVIGTGSCRVQSIPVIAEQADELVVFQRSAAYSRPVQHPAYRARRIRLDETRLPSIRAKKRLSPSGSIYSGALAVVSAQATQDILANSREKRSAKIEELGWVASLAWPDLLNNLDVNAAAVELYAELVCRTVRDPEVAESLILLYPMGCKRLIVDVDYYVAFNRPNVKPVDLRKGGIKAVTPPRRRHRAGPVRAGRARSRHRLRRDDRRPAPHRHPWPRWPVAARLLGRRGLGDLPWPAGSRGSWMRGVRAALKQPVQKQRE
jgi:cation diffusion facilitator CzcD-associated flavoprotein CzcO